MIDPSGVDTLCWNWGHQTGDYVNDAAQGGEAVVLTGDSWWRKSFLALPGQNERKT